MYAHLKERQHYEDRYDSSTIELCRHNEQMMLDVFLSSVEKALPELAENATTKDGCDPVEELARVHHAYHYF